MKKRMRVLIGYDGSTYAHAAIDDLRRAGLPEQAEALVVSVGEAAIVPPLASHEVIEKAFVGERVISIVKHANMHVSESLEDARDHAHTAMRQLELYFPNWRLRSEAVGGRPATELMQQAQDWSADLVVVGSQGRSAVGRLILGSVSLEVAMEAECSVRIGRRFKYHGRKARRIVVGLDGLAASERALKEVMKRSWPKNTELRIIAVDDGQSSIKVTEPGSTTKNQSGTIELASSQGLRVFAEIRKGDPATILMDEANAWKADCIFIGAAGFGTANDDLRNSVSTQLATNASCSIEIVR